MKRAAEGEKTSELMEDLDNNLVYGGAKRISEYESELLDQIDESCDYQIKMKRELDRVKGSLQNTEESLRKTDDAIGKYCSEMTQNKILLARGYQFRPEKEEEIVNALSDKEQIEQNNSQENRKSRVTMQSVVSNAISKGITTEYVAAADSVELTEKLEKNVKGEVGR